MQVNSELPHIENFSKICMEGEERELNVWGRVCMRENVLRG